MTELFESFKVQPKKKWDLFTPGRITAIVVVVSVVAWIALNRNEVVAFLKTIHRTLS
jgi:hypothetical protein